MIDSVLVSLAFFATLLAGEAVIFALSFSASSAWPSLREIDRHIAFREWVVTGWVAAMLTAAGLLTDRAVPIAYGALLFLLADVFGMLSFARLLGVVRPGRRRQGVELVRRGAAATPLTSYDVDMDGLFGDGDPSVYL